MSTPDIPLRPWTLMDLIEEKLAAGNHLSFILGEIAGAVTIATQQAHDFPMGPSIKHFCAGMKSARRKFDSLTQPAAAWHPFHGS